MSTQSSCTACAKCRHSWPSTAGPSSKTSISSASRPRRIASRYDCLTRRQVLRDSGIFVYKRQALSAREGLRVTYAACMSRPHPKVVHIQSVAMAAARSGSSPIRNVIREFLSRTNVLALDPPCPHSVADQIGDLIALLLIELESFPQGRIGQRLAGEVLKRCVLIASLDSDATSALAWERVAGGVGDRAVQWRGEDMPASTRCSNV